MFLKKYKKKENKEAVGSRCVPVEVVRAGAAGRAGEGWRWQPDRGSTTANHYDHVHVSVY